jgi:hypothetical protein
MEGGREGMDGAESVEERRGRRTVGRGRSEGRRRQRAGGEGVGFGLQEWMVLIWSADHLYRQYQMDCQK